LSSCAVLTGFFIGEPAAQSPTKASSNPLIRYCGRSTA